MFELSIASKYLIPRRRQLSVSIISLVSVLVIALVVWLILVFFSITHGLEKSWVQKLTALTAPIRITPTEAYYHSYYYLIDAISEASGYSHKTIREKQESKETDPYNPEIDQEPPTDWPSPDRHPDGSVKDLVKLVYASLNAIPNLPGLHGHDFELTATHIKLRLVRRSRLLHLNHVYGGTTESEVSYPAYLGNLDPDHPSLAKTLLPLDNRDMNNMLDLMGRANQIRENEQNRIFFEPAIFQSRLKHFFECITIKRLQAVATGWTIPRHLLPSKAEWDVCAVIKNEQVVKLLVPQEARQRPSLQQSLEEQGWTVSSCQAKIDGGEVSLLLPKQETQTASFSMLTLAGGSSFTGHMKASSLDQARYIDDVRFEAEIPIQGSLLKGTISYRGLEIASAEIHSSPTHRFPFWIHRLNYSDDTPTLELPKDPEIGEGILLPKSFRDVGVMVGDRGFLSYLSLTPSLLQEQQVAVYVAGFYDPGIIPIGGKFILANRQVTSLIRSSHQQNDNTPLTNGINVRFNRLEQADAVKAQLTQALKEKGISHYWNIETYHEYEFTKEMMRELQNQKHLFMLVAIVMIIVACSNIISMLIILVNDKKTQIGILRSMGASSQSIALIFALSGGIIGCLGSVGGIVMALLTLHNLNALVSFLSRLQGHEIFSAHLYGEVLPHELSVEALSFVLLATASLSLLAGLVPAIKACLLRPSQILRSSEV